LNFLQVDSVDVLSKINQAKQAFERQNFAEASALLLAALDIEPDNQTIQLALGICQLELGENEKAKQTFSVIDNPSCQEKAQWYLAMIFLKQRDVRNAQTILENIEVDEPNYKAAQDILKKL
jgi:thioredoxin-like negative regulator of GroEL